MLSAQFSLYGQGIFKADEGVYAYAQNSSNFLDVSNKLELFQQQLSCGTPELHSGHLSASDGWML